MCVLRYPPGASRVSPESGDGAGDPGAVGDQSQRTEDRVPLQCSPKSDGQPRPSSHSRRHYSKRLTHRLHSTRAERPHWAPDLPTQSPMSSPKPPPRLRRRQQSTGNIGLYVEESQEISVRISGEFFLYYSSSFFLQATHFRVRHDAVPLYKIRSQIVKDAKFRKQPRPGDAIL